jgi:hypothetical protein
VRRIPGKHDLIDPLQTDRLPVNRHPAQQQSPGALQERTKPLDVGLVQFAVLRLPTSSVSHCFS